MSVFAYEFTLAWSRVLENFLHLPEQLREELEPYKPLVQYAQERGSPLVGLAAQINAITVRHIHARLLPMDLRSFEGPATLQ
jgi:hypothetical protein